MPSKRNSFKYKIWRIVVSTPFEYFIMMLIVFNTLLLMMKVLIYSLDFVFVLVFSFVCRIIFGIQVFQKRNETKKKRNLFVLELFVLIFDFNDLAVDYYNL